MRKILIYAMGWALVALACSVDNDYIFDDISTHRLNQFIDECNEELVTAEHGWKFVYYPDTTQYGGFTFLMRFSDNEEGKRVEMQSDLNDSTSISSYSYNSALGPVLSFDTYSLLHLLADPNPEAAGGIAGLGYNADYEFLIIDVQKEKISLLGKKYKREAELVPATAEDWQNLPLQRNAMKCMEAFSPTDEDQPFYHYLRIGQDTAFCFYSPKLRMAYLTYAEGGETVAQKFPIYSTVNGVRFNRPVTFGWQTFSEWSFDSITRQMSIVDEGVADAEFFWAESTEEMCRLRFPGAVELSKTYSDGFSLVERGWPLSNGNTNLTPERKDAPIEGYRFWWNLVGFPASELYVRESNGIATYGKLWTDYIIEDGIGDRVRFEENINSKIGGMANGSTQTWWGFFYTADEKYMLDGVTIVPLGGQMYIVNNEDNSSWGLFTPLLELDN